MHAHTLQMHTQTHKHAHRERGEEGREGDKKNVSRKDIEIGLRHQSQLAGRRGATFSTGRGWPGLVWDNGRQCSRYSEKDGGQSRGKHERSALPQTSQPENHHEGPGRVGNRPATTLPLCQGASAGGWSGKLTSTPSCSHTSHA